MVSGVLVESTFAYAIETQSVNIRQHNIIFAHTLPMSTYYHSASGSASFNRIPWEAQAINLTKKIKEKIFRNLVFIVLSPNLDKQNQKEKLLTKTERTQKQNLKMMFFCVLFRFCGQIVFLHFVQEMKFLGTN